MGLGLMERPRETLLRAQGSMGMVDGKVVVTSRNNGRITVISV